MLGKLQTYKLQTTTFYEKGHCWSVTFTDAALFYFTGSAVLVFAASDQTVRRRSDRMLHPHLLH